MQIGVRGFAAVAALGVGGAIVLTLWDTTIGVVLAVLGAVTWWGLATVRELRSFDAAAVDRLPDHTVTPVQAARIESAENAAAGLGFGGGGDSGGGGGGS